MRFAKKQEGERSSLPARPLIVSFSGIDGAGKTTQIELLANWLGEAGLRVRLIRFWDEVASLRRWRESVGHALFKGDHGVGTPEKPVARRDKNVKAWYLPLLRLVLCGLDAVKLRMLLAGLTREGHDIVIFDRYIYDQVANLDLKNPGVRMTASLLLKLVSAPDVAYLIDADPLLARARKPEYPLEFLQWNRQCYLALGARVGMHVVSGNTASEVATTVRRIFANNYKPVSGITSHVPVSDT